MRKNTDKDLNYLIGARASPPSPLSVIRTGENGIY